MFPPTFFLFVLEALVLVAGAVLLGPAVAVVVPLLALPPPAHHLAHLHALLHAETAT